jgi:NAD+ diphosphatase
VTGPAVVPGLGAPLALARSATDRATERRSDDAWLAQAWADERTRVVRVGAGRTLLRGDGLAFGPTSAAPAGERFLLGVDDDGVAYFAVHEPDAPVPASDEHDVRAVGLREVGAALSDRDAGLLVLAIGLANWHETHTHCPRCGAATVVAMAGYVRRCPADGSEHYPRTDPAVIVLVTDVTGDRCLLGASARWAEHRFSTLAGFVEPGESAEAAVVREVREEAAVTVSDVVYLASQPWPFPSSLMLGFTARVADADAQPQADGAELTVVRWFPRSTLANLSERGEVRLPPRISIARRLIEHWYGGPLPDGPGWA